MKKRYLIIAINLLYVSVVAAQTHDKNLQGIIEAERSFARTAREKGTQPAFMEYLSDESILYSRGEIVNGKKLWESRTGPDSALLVWWPVYADVSQSGDFGYTTGPFEFFVNRKDAAPAWTGFYSSVWKKEKNGEWKVITDLGANNRTRHSNTGKVESPSARGEKTNTAKAESEIRDVESAYVKQLNASSVSFKKDFLADEFRLHRPSAEPCASLEQLSQLNEATSKFSYENAGMQVASSGDMAFTYGKVKVEINRDNNVRTIPANYFRVWKKFSGQWKIVFDVIGMG